jgi:hypothetical protein
MAYDEDDEHNRFKSPSTWYVYQSASPTSSHGAIAIVDMWQAVDVQEGRMSR